MIEVKLELEKPMTDKEIDRLAKENNLKIRREIKGKKQYIYLQLEENLPKT